MIKCTITNSDIQIQQVKNQFKDLIGRFPTNKEVEKLFDTLVNCLYDNFITSDEFEEIIIEDFKKEYNQFNTENHK